MKYAQHHLNQLLAALLLVLTVMLSSAAYAESQPAVPETPAVQTMMININQASESELQQLTGIGPAKAKRIIEFRTQNGPFKSIEALTQVKGVSLGILEKNQGKIGI